MGGTKPVKSLATQLKRITERSGQDPKAEFKWLMPLCTPEALTGCFHELKRNKAVGIDGQTKEEYGQNLEANINNLIDRMKAMSYRPGPVRQVLIPKDNGGMRKLGIANLEDKIVQMMYSKVLTAIYEPLFHDASYGFRAGRNCHDAIEALHSHIFRNWTEAVVDVDLARFFDTVDHSKLVALLRLKIKDERFIRYIIRMLRAGVLAEGELQVSDEGTPQGSIVSPVLANIFAHYAIDEWFAKMVKPNCHQPVYLNRYCDDAVIVCNSSADAAQITKALEKRLDRFGLQLNLEKTKVVPFSKRQANQGIRQGVFDYLGFTFYLGKSRHRTYVPKLKTSGKRYHKKLKSVTEWCRKRRNTAKMTVLWDIFRSKLRGHNQYYAVSFNGPMVENFNRRAIRIFVKWLNRRSQKRAQNWEKFKLFMDRFPPPKVQIRHNLFGYGRT